MMGWTLGRRDHGKPGVEFSKNRRFSKLQKQLPDKTPNKVEEKVAALKWRKATPKGHFSELQATTDMPHNLVFQEIENVARNIDLDLIKIRKVKPSIPTFVSQKVTKRRSKNNCEAYIELTLHFLLFFI
jgi:predicted transcriptional regulator YdeE